MSKRVHCPQCGSVNMIKNVPDTDLGWICKNCGYRGTISVEDGNLEKQMKELKKMEKLNRKLLRPR
jgi:transposase-like protein